MKNGVIGRTTDGFFRYQAWPTVAKDEKGVLYAAFSGHRLGLVCPFGKNLLYISHDDGESWLGPIIANDDYMDDRDAGLVAWGDGQLLLSWFVHPREFYKGREGKNVSVTFPLSLATRQEWESLSDEDHTENLPSSGNKLNSVSESRKTLILQGFPGFLFFTGYKMATSDIFCIQFFNHFSIFYGIMMDKWRCRYATFACRR